jgi:hypothetical protein
MNLKVLVKIHILITRLRYQKLTGYPMVILAILRRIPRIWKKNSRIQGAIGWAIPSRRGWLYQLMMQSVRTPVVRAGLS